jgi:hypothetical protein
MHIGAFPTQDPMGLIASKGLNERQAYCGPMMGATFINA